MSNKGILGLITTLFAIFILVVGLFVFTERVPEGKVAVVYTPANGAERVLNPGWHLIGLFEKTQEYPTRITIIKDKISVTTSDGKKITMPVRYEYKVDRNKVLDIFKELGSQNIEQIQEGYLYQKLFKASREVVSHYSVLDIYGTKTSEASAKVTEHMVNAVKDLGFIINDVTLGTPEVDKETQKAIDERIKASQELEKKQIELEIAKKEAERKLIQAKAEADANRIISESITKELIDMKLAEARLKHGWIEVQGSAAVIKE